MTAIRRNWTLGIVSVALFMVVLDNLVVSVALPSIRRDFGASIQSLEWTVNAYVLGTGALVALLLPFRTPRAADAALAAEQEWAVAEPPLAVLAGDTA
jgi:predicted MFS family arabinose efflux permease